MSNTTTSSQKIVLEHLQRILADISEMKRDTRHLKDEVVSLRAIMGEFIKADARRESDYLHLAARVDRSKRWLDLQEQPPA
jgi:hypothetical protein